MREVERYLEDEVPDCRYDREEREEDSSEDHRAVSDSSGRAPLNEAATELASLRRHTADALHTHTTQHNLLHNCNTTVTQLYVTCSVTCSVNAVQYYYDSTAVQHEVTLGDERSDWRPFH